MTRGTISPDTALHLEINRVLLRGDGPEADAALARCPDAECRKCSVLVCPHGDPMHFHHDGCPSCAEAEPCPSCTDGNHPTTGPDGACTDCLNTGRLR